MADGILKDKQSLLEYYEKLRWTNFAFIVSFLLCGGPAENDCIISTAPIKVDGQWHHICYVWENSNGSWKLYEDGEEIKEGSDFAKGQIIVPTGILILGQDQDSYGGGFETKNAFVGDLSQVNMWDRVLSGDDISGMSKGCHSEDGNVFKWSDFKSGVHGDATVVTPGSCGARQ